MRDEAPEGWVTASPLALAELVRGVSYKAGEAAADPAAGRLPLLRANNIADDLTFKDLQYVPESRVSLAQRLRRGDVIVAMSSGSKAVVGKAASLGEPWAGTFGAFCGVLRPSAVLDADYFGLYFKTNDYRRAISAMSAGTSINNLRREYFDRLSVPVAPLAEQKRIVAKVEELVIPVKAARERLALVRAILKRLRHTVLDAACSGKLTVDWHGAGNPRALSVGRADGPFEVPANWIWRRFGELLGSIRSGSTAVPRTEVTDFPILRSSSVRCGVLDLEDARYLTAKQSEAEANYVSEGDLLFTRLSGSLDFVGNCARVPALGGRRIQYPDRLFCAKLKDPCDGQFIELVFSAPFVQRAMRDVAKSSAGHQRISMGAITNLRVPYPPRSEQHEIVRRVTGILAIAERLERRVASASARADALNQSILSKALRGELVPTEAELARAEARNYESAGALLARVQSERAATVPTTGGRRRVARRAGARP